MCSSIHNIISRTLEFWANFQKSILKFNWLLHYVKKCYLWNRATMSWTLYNTTNSFMSRRSTFSSLLLMVSSLSLCSLFRNFGIIFFWSKLKMWHSDMVHQSTFIHCTEITFGALEIKKQSLSSMSGLHMCSQIFLFGKIFFAIGTSKYLSSRTITLHVVFNIVHCETLEIAMITTDLFQISIVWVGPI